jgi:acylphosphatase
MSERVARRLRIHGRVQGVGYRYAMREVAGSLGLSGWVRNCRDGTVEAVVEGPAAQVEEAIRWARQGPGGAQVTQVDESPDPGGCEGFAWWPTA